MTPARSIEVPGFIDVVDGRTMPQQIARHPGLELCNTFVGWDDPGDETYDYLRDHADACIWAMHAGLVDQRLARAARRAGSRAPKAANRCLAELRALRGALHAVLTRAPSKDARRIVAERVEEAMAALVLEFHGDTAQLALSIESAERLPVVAAARAAADLLTGTERSRIRVCPGVACGWLFLDPTGRRRWCLMASCGNRAKVRRYASTHR